MNAGMHACLLLQHNAPQVEVETLRYTLTDLQETCAQAETSSSGRPAATIELPTIQPPGASAALYVMLNAGSHQQAHKDQQGNSISCA